MLWLLFSIKSSDYYVATITVALSYFYYTFYYTLIHANPKIKSFFLDIRKYERTKKVKLFGQKKQVFFIYSIYVDIKICSKYIK